MFLLLLEVLVTFLVGYIAYYYYGKLFKDNTSLPEPFSLPLFGHMFFLGLHPHKKITKWYKTHGKIFGLQLGPTIKTVVFNDASYIREAYNMNEFSGRSDEKSFSLMADGKNGIVSSDGQIWIEQRRFTMRHLRDFGFGRKTMENLIMEEASDLVEGFVKSKGTPVVVQKQFSLAVLNSLWQIVTGTRYSQDDPKLNEILQRANEAFSESAANVIVAFFPDFASKFPNITGWKKFNDTVCNLLSFFREQVTEHKKTFDENNSRDLIDTYLQEINKTTDVNSSFYKDMGEKQLVAVIGDMFNAGSETTSNVLQWSILYLSQHQEVQIKLKSEIEQVVGKSKMPSLADKPNMPYTEALIMEILRKSSIVPIGVMHTMMSTVEFKGYIIPKGYGVLTNFYGIHHDPAIWGDPENFRPERFIDENGQCIKKHDSLMPFSVGKRACIGESLARDTIFLFLTSIFQRFEVTPDPATKNVTLEPKRGFLLAPQPFKVMFKEV